MTKPETPHDGGPPPRRDTDGADGVALLVRHTLAAVADATEVVPRPLDRSSAGNSILGTAADEGAPASLLAPAAELDLVADDVVPVVPIGVEPARARRAGGRWLAGVAAAALVLLVIGLVAVVADDGTVSTGPGNPDPSPTAAAPAPFDDATFVSPPRTVGDIELADISVTGWRADGAEVAADPEITVTTNRVLPPFIAAAASGVIINYSFTSTSGDGGEEEEPVHVFVRTGVTLDPIGADMPGTEPVPAVDGLTVARLEGCVPARTSSDPVSSEPTPLSEAPVLAEPRPSPSCRVAVTAWTADHIISIDAIDPALVDEVLEGLRRETLVELEARLAGVAHVGDIRRALAAAAGSTVESSAGSAPAPTASAPLTTLPTPASTPEPAPSACAAWDLVEHHLRETGDRFDAASGEDLLGFQAFAPPELEADVARLVQLAIAPGAVPERDEILARIRASMNERCPA